MNGPRTGMVSGFRALRTSPRTLATACLPAVAALALAACGGDDAEGGGGSGGSAAAGAGTSAPAAQALVVTKDVAGYGEALHTRGGKPLYVHTNDPSGGSSCEDACLEKFAPLTKKGELTGGPGVDPELLSTFKRADGTEQVLYRDNALYTYKAQGLAAGQEAHGGTWYLIAPNGDAIQGTAAGGY